MDTAPESSGEATAEEHASSILQRLKSTQSVMTSLNQDQWCRIRACKAIQIN